MDEKRLNSIFHGVADGTRRKIISILRECGEMRVGDIADAFSMSLNGVSKHLKVLEKAELVQRRVEGRTHYISICKDGIQDGYEWFHLYHNFWNQRLEQLESILVKKGESHDK